MFGYAGKGAIGVLLQEGGEFPLEIGRDVFEGELFSRGTFLQLQPVERRPVVIEGARSQPQKPFVPFVDELG